MKEKNHFHVLLGVVLWWKSVQVVCEFACGLVWENKYIKMKLRDVRDALLIAYDDNDLSDDELSQHSALSVEPEQY